MKISDTLRLYANEKEYPLSEFPDTVCEEFLRIAVENEILKKVCATQAAVIDNSIERNRIGVNINAIVGVGLRLYWASKGDFDWLSRDARDLSIRKIWERKRE
jgi:hypothetical protein